MSRKPNEVTCFSISSLVASIVNIIIMIIYIKQRHAYKIDTFLDWIICKQGLL